MSNTWVVSDTHFNDSRIITAIKDDGTLIRPGFDNISQHDDYLIDCWNSVVRPNDTVWHLGDVVRGDDWVGWMESNWHRLNGTKNLIVGNHDQIDVICQHNWFKKIQMWQMILDYKIVLSHVPIQEASSRAYPPKDNPNLFHDQPILLLNVHGHIHHIPSPAGRYCCVCVEQTNYIPVNLEELNYNK